VRQKKSQRFCMIDDAATFFARGFGAAPTLQQNSGTTKTARSAPKSVLAFAEW
jgi:hypothetical protein